jgi:hypothetical protein
VVQCEFDNFGEIMKKVLLSTLLVASCPVFATTYQLQSGPPIEYSLPPNEPQEFSNVFMWKVKATCKIITQEEQVPIAFTVLRKKGSVNNVNMSAGDPTLTLIFYPNQKVDIVAEPGGVVQLKNLGEKIISASCTTT